MTADVHKSTVVVVVVAVADVAVAAEHNPSDENLQRDGDGVAA
jgi:hypothetical protein